MLLILGGSFDPVHLGHEAAADAALAACPGARLAWVPAAHAPHKPGLDPAPAPDRLALVRIVAAARGGERVHCGELERPPPSYTVDTLEELRAAAPAESLALIVGADSLGHLARWREPLRVFGMASFLVVPRGGAGESALEAFRAGLAAGAARAFRARWLPMPEHPASSTAIRAALRAGARPAGLRPEVEAEIRRRGLYGARPD